MSRKLGWSKPLAEEEAVMFVVLKIQDPWVKSFFQSPPFRKHEVMGSLFGRFCEAIQKGSFNGGIGKIPEFFEEIKDVRLEMMDPSNTDYLAVEFASLNVGAWVDGLAAKFGISRAGLFSLVLSNYQRNPYPLEILEDMRVHQEKMGRGRVF
ncbi:MAG TPA: hypothetical protein VJB99_03460 [Patescibacteria group bacterium]|nr:hypothetical protein [Patescibacteria group bacterium]